MRPPFVTVLPLLALWTHSVAAAPRHEAYRSETPDLAQEEPWSWRAVANDIFRKVWPVAQTERGFEEEWEEINAAVSADEKRLSAKYGGEMVVRFRIKTPEEAQALASASRRLFLDVWEMSDDWVDILLTEKVLRSLLRVLPASLQDAHEPLMSNVDLVHAILDTRPPLSATEPRSSKQSRKGNIFFADYQPYSVIVPWMNLMASMFSTHVRRINVGISYEGRDIPALRVGVHPTNKEKKPATRKTILVTGGSHAREWISTSTVNYLAWSMINSYGKSHEVTKMLEAFDFVFVPTLNPDGYVYTWDTDRLWRKNRQRTSSSWCKGIDLDRNFGYKWDGGTADIHPCSETYPGRSPFEAVETQRFAEWAKNETEHNNVEFLGLLDLHSYSQQILYPYSYTCDQDPPTIETLEELALGLAKAIRLSRKGHTYKAASACEGNVAMSDGTQNQKDRRIYPRIEMNGGSALDWFYHELRVKYAYQVKLRDTGNYGFLLPKEDIVPTGEEFLQALLFFGRYALGKVGMAVDERPPLAPLATQERDEGGEFLPPQQEVLELRR